MPFNFMSGKTLKRVVIKSGNGVVPPLGSQVTVNCTGYIASPKKMFWSTKAGAMDKHNDDPFTFRIGMGQVIRGWDEGVALMSIGEVAELFVPSNYAYGSAGFMAWGIPPNADLIFEIELLDFQ